MKPINRAKTSSTPRTAKRLRKLTVRRWLGNEALSLAHPRFRELLNAREMDFFLTSDHGCVRALVTDVLAELRAKGFLPSKRHERRRKRHLAAILLNLFAAHARNRKCHVAIGLSRGKYSERGRYRSTWASHSITTALLAALQKSVLMERAGGFKDRESGKGFVTRIRASQALVAKFQSAGLQVRMLSRAPEYELIRLKDDGKKLTDYEESKRTRSMRSRLARINAALRKVFVGLQAPDEEVLPLMRHVQNPEEWFEEEERVPVDFTNTQLYRVFNDRRFDRGGRFYGGWWQSVPSRLRKHIRIWDDREGVPGGTREVDYSCMQPALAYTLVGRPPPADAYAVPGLRGDAHSVRSLLKAVLLRMLNACCRRGALKSLRKYYTEAKLGSDLPPPEEVLTALESHHARIKSLFYKGWAGKRLMHLESQIAEQVILEMCRLGTVALPIHDSFIVIDRYVDDLVSAMNSAFLKRTGYACKLSVDETEGEHYARLVNQALDPTSRAKKRQELTNVVARIKAKWGKTGPSRKDLERAGKLTEELETNNPDLVFLQILRGDIRRAAIYTGQLGNWLNSRIKRTGLGDTAALDMDS